MSNDLLSAVKEGNLSKVKAQLAAGDNINYQDSAGRTAIILASGFGFVKIVEYLISQNADNTIRAHDGESAIISAVTYEKIEVIKCFVQLKKASQHDLEEAFLNAAKCNHLEIIKYLLSLDTPFNCKSRNGRSAFLIAVKYGSLQVAQYMYNLNPSACLNDRDNQGNNAYSLAVQQGHSAMIKKLLQLGFYVENARLPKKDHRSTHEIYFASIRIFKVIDSKNVNEFLKISKTLGGAVNGRNSSDGNSAFHLAAIFGNLTALFTLFKNGANIDLCNHKNETPYQLATNHKNLFVQTTAHFFKTLQLHKQSQNSSIQSQKQGIYDNSDKADRKLSHEISEINTLTKPKKSPRLSIDTTITKLYQQFDIELETLKKKLEHLEKERIPFYSQESQLLSYMYLCLGEILKDENPDLAAALFQRVRSIESDTYFASARFNLYYLIKSNRLTIESSPNSDPEQLRKRLLIQQLLYAKKEKDNEGTTLVSLIKEYTFENLENFFDLAAFSFLLTSDLVILKDAFLKQLDYSRTTNYRAETLLKENLRLKELKADFCASCSELHESPMHSCVSSPLPSIPENHKRPLSAGSVRHPRTVLQYTKPHSLQAFRSQTATLPKKQTISHIPPNSHSATHYLPLKTHTDNSKRISLSEPKIDHSHPDAHPLPSNIHSESPSSNKMQPASHKPIRTNH